MAEIAPNHRKVFFVIFPDYQVIDVAGPMEAFGKANDYAGDYAISLLAKQAGPIQSSGPVTLVADRSYLEVTEPDLLDLDTLIVCGGEGANRALTDKHLIDFITCASQQARRVVSICTGALILAQAGLLDGRRATTHWDSVDLLARNYPEIKVESDPIYVCDGKYWTSAGVTAGIDLSLALIEKDLGAQTALAIARRLVVYMMRPGGQSQFSAQLKFQRPKQNRLSSLIEWIELNPAQDLGITALAARCAMSERHFARCFAEEVGITPARFVEQSRLEQARRLLEQTDETIERIAHDCGFGSTEILRRTFQRHLHLAPSDYRHRFGTSLRKGIST